MIPENFRKFKMMNFVICALFAVNLAISMANTTNMSSSSSVSKHFQASHHHHHHLHQRSVPEFEATLNAMKCALRIVGLQVSEHHNNMIMCCGLWKMKSFMKQTADRVCENAPESKRVFDDFMTDELIYGKFTHSILGDDTLSCQKYPEGSSTCERLFAFITFIIVLIILSIIILIITCCLTTICWYKSRRDFHRLLAFKLDESTSAEKDAFLRDHYEYEQRMQRKKRFFQNFKILIPGQPLESGSKRRPPYDRTTARQSTDLSTGKSSPDSAIPPSTNSTTTSRNTSTLTLNDNNQNSAAALQNKPPK